MNLIIVIMVVINTIIAALAVVVSYLGLRQSKDTHVIVNSRLSGWLALEREQGNTAGREAQKKETEDEGKVQIKGQ